MIPCKNISIKSTQINVSGSRVQIIIRKRTRKPDHVPKHKIHLSNELKKELCLFT
jgi:hypothetical protein